MALFFKVKRAGDLASALASHDLHASFVDALFDAENSRTPAAGRDACRTAPWCFLPDWAGVGGFIVMTCRVPWLPGPGHPLQRAADLLDPAARPVVDLPERVQDRLDLAERDVVAFTDDGGYPAAGDDPATLEERAVADTCAAMGWEVPADWRADRARARRDAGDAGRDDKRRRCSPSGDGEDDDHLSVDFYDDDTSMDSYLDEDEDGGRGWPYVDEEEELCEYTSDDAFLAPRHEDVRSIEI